MKPLLRVILAIACLIFFAASYHAIPAYAGQDASIQPSVQQSSELVKRDAQGKITHLLSSSPQTESKATAMENPPGYDAIIENGFPVQTLHDAGGYGGGPGIHTLVGDVNGDGFQEIVVSGLAAGPLYVFDYQGNFLPGWPHFIGGDVIYPAMQQGYIVAAGVSGNIIVYDKNGTRLWQGLAWNYIASPPSIGFLSGMESWGIFLEQEDSYLHGYRLTDGMILPGWPVKITYSQECHTPAIADIDDDGENEMITASGSSSSGTTISAYNEDGTSVPGWPIIVEYGETETYPVIGDVDGDGEIEVIVIRSFRFTGFPDPSYVDVYAANGSFKRTWQLSGNLDYGTAPALADFNGDNFPEIVVQTETALNVTDGFGTPLPGWPLLLTGTNLKCGNSSPIVGDVDGDGFNEIVFTSWQLGYDTGLVHVVNHDGTYVPNFPMQLLIGEGAVPAIADIDLDGHNEIIITGDFWSGQAGYFDKVWVFDLDRDNPSAQHGGIEWGQFGANMRHTHVYKVIQPDRACLCVSNAAELQDALTQAQSNGVDDFIKVVQGAYNGNFTYSSSEGNSITIRGGYTAGCKGRDLNLAHTILDGGNTGHVLELSNSAGGDITVDGFSIQHGSNVSNGGGIFAQSFAASSIAGSITITNNILTANSVTTSGGGIYAISESTSGTAGTVSIANNLIFGNAALNLDGGGLYAASFSPSDTAGTVTLTNNTITGNSAQHGGGVSLAIGTTSGSISAYNNIIWGNSATTSGDDIYLSKGTGVANSYNNDYANKSGDTWDSESGKMIADPLFAGGNDYHLQATSSCIDAGTNSAPSLLATDFEGNPRIMDGNRDGDAIVDMGADEYYRIWFVDGDMSLSGEGSSWSQAFKTIGEALGASSGGDEIWVKQGSYLLTAQLTVDKVVHMYGGFAGTETARNQRNWVHSTTTVNGQNAGYRCFHVTADATIDGFTITQCNNKHAYPDMRGGGIYNEGASPTITNCIFLKNGATSGGGIGNKDSSPLIINCTFSGNITNGGGGGGIDNYNSYPTIINSTFTGNNYGGLVNQVGSSPTITNCIFWGDTGYEIRDLALYSIVTYSDIQGGYTGMGNIDADPRFANASDPDPANWNLHLQSASPCIDAGTNSAPMISLTDFEGDSRVFDGNKDGTATVDMGADEYVPIGYIILHRDGAIWHSDTDWDVSTPPYYPGTDYARGLELVGSGYVILHRDGAICSSANGWLVTSPPYHPGTNYAVDLKVAVSSETIILHRDGALWSSATGWETGTPPYYPGTAYAKALEVRGDASYVIMHRDGAIYDSASGWVVSSPPYHPGTNWAVDMKLDGSGYVLLHRDGALWSSSTGWNTTGSLYHPGTDYARALKLMGSHYAILHKDGAIYDSVTGWNLATPPYYPGTAYAVDLKVQ
jgi:hypothetical protein